MASRLCIKQSWNMSEDRINCFHDVQVTCLLPPAYLPNSSWVMIALESVSKMARILIWDMRQSSNSAGLTFVCVKVNLYPDTPDMIFWMFLASQDAIEVMSVTY